MQVRGKVKGHGLLRSEQPLEFRLQLRAAQMGGDHGAILVDEDRMGNAADAIELRGAAAPSPKVTDVIGPNQSVLVYGPLPLRGVFVE